MAGVAVPLPLHTMRAAYTELGQSVAVALRTQMGDAARLGVQKGDCLRLLALTEQVRVLNRCTYTTTSDTCCS